MCLDVLRAIERDPEAFHLLLADLGASAAGHAALQARLARLADAPGTSADMREAGARALVQDLVLAAQGVLMLRTAPQDVAEAFIASRLDAEGGKVYGTLPHAVMNASARILKRAWPL
jgi:putative acyl-CoA dehydrogenase